VLVTTDLQHPASAAAAVGSSSSSSSSSGAVLKFSSPSAGIGVDGAQQQQKSMVQQQRLQ
jgi:hypothetical protein